MNLIGTSSSKQSWYWLFLSLIFCIIGLFFQYLNLSLSGMIANYFVSIMCWIFWGILFLFTERVD